MSYTPTNWQTGDVVTAEKLNKLENGVASGGVYTESETVRFSGEVTTENAEGMGYADIECELSDAPEQITVVFDGTEYTVSKSDIGGENFAYGGIGETGPDFSEYPFAIAVTKQTIGPITQWHTAFYTETVSTHQVVIKADTKAVNQELADAISGVMPIMQLVNGETLSADAVEAFESGKLLYFYYTDPSDDSRTCYMVTGINTSTKRFTFVPENSDIVCTYLGAEVAIEAPRS